MFEKIKKLIQDIKDLIELADAIAKFKAELGKDIAEECESLKLVIQASPSTLDDAIIPILDKVILICRK